MLRNKLNLFLLNLIPYLLCYVSANESSEEEYNSEESYNVSSSSNEVNGRVNTERKQRRYINKNIWTKDRMAQIIKCQNKLFGNEIEIKREFYLEKKTQMKIIDNYFNENLEFKQSYGHYKKTCVTENEIEVF
uniref:Uncharacterized protein n=1 Tax=Meloidogyne enterolobii TaxID=390850 RepID=A0A6V7TT92_MELEN|nr:unnamed protein product [Meloidogyne enterolobii]